MGLFDDIQKEYIQARKDQDKFATLVLSLLISDLKNERINLRKESLEDSDVIGVIAKTVKQKKDAAAEFKAAGRDDLSDKEETEIKFLSKYMPEAISRDELLKVVREVKDAIGALSPSDMGRMMKEVMAKVKGRADGSMVKDAVNEVLK